VFWALESKCSGRGNLTINVPLILKVREIIIFFAGKTYNGRGPLEKSQEMPHYTYVLPQTKKQFPALSESEIRTLVFLCPREREREREEGEKERKSARDYISKPPGRK
jgi:hypothetical protein